MSTILEDLQISGMSCQHCVNAVEGALQAVPGVTVAEVSVGRARVRYDPGAVSADVLRRALADEGYALEGTERVA